MMDDLRAFGAFLRSTPRSLIDRLLTDLDKARVEAKAMDLEQDFELAWAYEKERARDFPGAGLTPKYVLMLVVKVGSK